MNQRHTSSASSVDSIARKLSRLEHTVRVLTTTPQLAHSSVEGGTLDFNDQMGNQIVVVGELPDGTGGPMVVGGPPPPPITGVSAEPVPAGVLVRWDGTWGSELGVAPLDFARVEIHVSGEGPDFDPDLVGNDSETLQGTINSTRGGRFAVTGLAYNEVWLKLVPRALTGKWGEPTPAIGPIVPGRLSQGDFEEQFLSAGFLLTGAIQVGDIGQPNPILISGTEGFVAPQPDGGEIRFPVDGSLARITAALVAYTLHVRDGFVMYGQGQVSGQLQLANTVQPPSSRMGTSTEWPSIQTALAPGMDAGVSNHVQGLVDHHSQPNWLVSAISSQIGSSKVSALRLIHRTNGGLTAYPDPTSSQPWVWNFESIGGVTRVGSQYFVLGVDRVRQRTYVYRIQGDTWAKSGEWEIGTGPTTFPYRPRLITDGTRVGVVWVRNDRALQLRWYSTSGTIQGSDTEVTYPYPGHPDLGDAYYGAAGATFTRLYVASRLGDSASPSALRKVRAYNLTAGPSPDTTRDFAHASGTQIIGMHYDIQQGRMLSLHNTSTLWTYSKFTTATWLGCIYTWYDGDDSPYPPGTLVDGVDVSGLPSGTRETTPSPLEALYVPPRAWPVFETPPPPDEQVTDPAIVDRANRVGIYIQVNDNPYVRHAYLSNTAGRAERVVRGIDSFATSGPPPPTVNTFLTAKKQPGVVYSAATRLDGQPRFEADGAGAGRHDGLIPPGAMVFWHSPFAPPGWKQCNGLALSRTLYPDLFDAIGTTYGAGNGTTTFNVPPQTTPSGLYLIIKA